ncbi:uncharacterized protein TrAtP1_004811 [Trichoderma atroviride]|uniref:uncharacterized protein n=1 Tax=Hypocrea atroviridis TaxID=63577 RepID=UPI00331B0231|nr:hypothetical protein TrAtP1_004811 [Trichoderma atroviride]
MNISQVPESSIDSVQTISILKQVNPAFFSHVIEDEKADLIEYLGSMRTAGQLRKRGALCL